MTDACCCNCNTFYPMDARVCPQCGMTNPNVDMETATAEVQEWSDDMMSEARP